MSAPREVKIRVRESLFKSGPFEINKLVVAHTQNDGKMSADQERLVFDRGNAAAVLLFNIDTRCVVVVDQFRAPTLGVGNADGWLTESAGGGWLTEALAGVVDKPESPIRTAIRETLEETGYEVQEPKHGQVEQDGDLRLIAKFFSSPGGSSELIYLYFAKVSNAKKGAEGGGLPNEDIKIREIPIEELFEMIKAKQIEDPKLLIGALYLQHELRELGREPLATNKVKHRFTEHPQLSIGYITGTIDGVCDDNRVSIWVNSENEDMVMDRFNGTTISASIRFLGAAKDAVGNLTEDTIAEELTNAVGSQAPVPIGTVLKTGSGSLEMTHGVHKVFHVATVKGARPALDFKANLATRAKAPKGFKADPDDLAPCVLKVLREADRSNQGVWRRFWRWVSRREESSSILFPVIGAGDAGLRVDQVVPKLIEAAIGYLDANHARTTIKEIYFMAYHRGTQECVGCRA
jgi:nudix-type nucleoside diphosphatase (YffH/AdpP family)